MELWNKTVGLPQQVQQSYPAEIPIKNSRALANSPRYVTNRTLHTDLNIPYVRDVIHKIINKHHKKLEAQPHPLLEPLPQPIKKMLAFRHARHLR